MNNMDSKPNSNKYRPEQNGSGDERKKLDKVITGKAKVKKNEIRKFTDVFIAEDAREVKSYILLDLLIPRLKDTVVDIITGAVNMLAYGKAGTHRSTTNASRVSYRSFYDKKDEPRTSEAARRGSYNFYDITLDSRPEAEEVLDRLDEAIKAYGMVSVGDLYDLVGISGEYTDQKYGWYNLRNASVVRVSDGWLLKMPKAMPLH